MSQASRTSAEWDFLVGYPWDEAEPRLREAGVSFQLKFTAPPNKVSSQGDSYVICVRAEEPLVIICASPDWTVN